MNHQANVETTISCKFTEYTGEPDTRPPFQALESSLTAPLEHPLDGHDCLFLLIPAGRKLPLDFIFFFFPRHRDDPDTQKSFEWTTSMPVFADGDYDEETIELIAEGAKIEDGYLTFPLRRGDRWAFWPGMRHDALCMKNYNPDIPLLAQIEGYNDEVQKWPPYDVEWDVARENLAAYMGCLMRAIDRLEKEADARPDEIAAFHQELHRVSHELHTMRIDDQELVNKSLYIYGRMVRSMMHEH